MLFHTMESLADTVAAGGLTPEETLAVAQEVQQDLAQFKPNVIMDTLKSWIPGLVSFGYRLLVVILILIIGSRIIKFISNMLKRSFTRMDMEISLRKFLISLIEAGMYSILIFMAADKLGFNSASIIAVLGSAGLALGLALQGSLANFAGGVLILLMKPFKVDDYIITESGEGTVTAIGLVYTTLRTVDNKVIVVPNGNLSNAPLTNVTAQDKRRVDILVGISYQSDLKMAKEIVEDTFKRHPLVLLDEDITVFVDSLADSSVNIGGRGWTATSDYWTVKWSVMESVKLAFDEAGIEIPYNQLDVHVVNQKDA